MKRPRVPGRPRRHGGGSRSLSAPQLLWRFTAAGVLVLGTLAGLIAVLARQTGTEQAMDRASETTYLMAKAVVEPRLTPEVVAGDPDALRRFSAQLGEFAPEGSLVRVKLWDADGRVVYSDDPRLIGRRYPLAPPEAAALTDRGTIDPQVSPLDEPENRYEAGFGKLLEVYVGVESTIGQPLLFEAYYRYDAVADAGRAAWQRFAPPALGALLVLELVQVPFAWSLARRLSRQQEDRERLLRYAVDSSDAERRRIAGDLHDGVIQDLTGLTFALDATRLGNASEADRSRVIADGAVRLRSSISELRTLMVDLYPPNLDTMGLDAALRELAANLEQHGIAVELDLRRIDGLTSELTALLFRGAQEAIRNVVAHSDARLVTIGTQVTDGRAVLEIEDDGRGFNAPTLDRRREVGHFGLRTLGDLLTDSGGTLSVESAPGAGTRVRLEVPLP
jgi:two-component system, NarL family, sensor kinase